MKSERIWVRRLVVEGEVLMHTRACCGRGSHVMLFVIVSDLTRESFVHETSPYVIAT